MLQRGLSLFILALLQHLSSVGQTVGHDRSVRMWATVQAAPPRITLDWLGHSNVTGYTVYRKLKGGTSWGGAIATLGGTALQYVDNTVAVNTSYEYKIIRTTANLGNGYGYVNAGIELAMVEGRGKLVLLVDDIFTGPLAAQITQLIQDFEGDGYTVIRHDVSRTAPVTTIKALVTAAYNADPTNVKAVLCLGHVPIPMSGNLAPDGHGEHYGAWVADAYYGEMNGTWTDNTVNSTSAAWTRNHNVPGDGKFDQTIIPTAVELQVGRIDFYDLPAFSQSETQLTANYLNRLHQWKVKQLTSVERAVIDDNFTGYGDAFSQNGWRGFAPLVHPSNVVAGDYHTALASGSHLWSYGCGGGWWTNANGVSSTEQFASSSPQAIFTILFGSYFGDWDFTNNLMRASLASGTTLSNFWAGYPNWYFHHMGLGETIGFATVTTQNNGNGHYEPANPQPGRVHVSLLGDPSLRMHIVAPPGNVAASSTNGISTTVSWTASPETGLAGYHVHRFSNATQQWERRTTTAVNGTSFVDNTTGLNGTVRYMVRALKLQVSPSGSYWNLSLGAFGQATLNQVVTDCLGVTGGSALPGSPCNDGNACTTNDAWSPSCQCVGTNSGDTDGDGTCNALDGCPLDPNKIAPGQCGCGNPEPGAACNDGNSATINDVIGANCQCAGQLVDCLGVAGGSALPGTACDDNNAATGNDAWSAQCQCIGQVIDCLGVAGGGASPGSPCNDDNTLTVNDAWTAQCQCVGQTVDCLGVPNGTAVPGSPCSDGDPLTGNDTWSASCQCTGLLIDCNGVPGGGAVIDNCGVCGGNDDCIDVSACFTLTGSPNPDGEEASNGNIYNSTGAIDLVFDGEPNPWRGNQFVALRFTGVSVPPGATVVSAHVQFTSRGTSGLNPCALQVSLQDADDAASLGWTPFNFSQRPRTATVPWSPPLWPTANQSGIAQRTPNLAGIVQSVINRPGWAAGNSVVAFVEGVGRRSSWSWDQDPARAARLCVAYALPPLDCQGVPGGTAMPGSPCDDGNAATGNDTWQSDCTCAGLAFDCMGVPGGSALPGTPCDDGNATTGSDTWQSDCTCAGVLIDCLGIPGGSALPGAPCDDAMALTINDAFGTDCLCAGDPVSLDCEGVIDGPALPGTACDDNDASTGNDAWNVQCECFGLPIDCAGVPGGSALPGAPCDDGDPQTGNDLWQNDCDCAGLPVDCAGSPGGSSWPGSPCDDGDPQTGDDVWQSDCTCAGLLIDCAGIPGGSAWPGTPCDDGDTSTGNDAWGTDCTCAGEAIDCLGVIGGPALPGSPCDDGDASTGNDAWTAACDCAGLPLDCLGQPGGTDTIGTPCDDGDPLTGNDSWGADCECAGLLIDCEGIAGGFALPGSGCDDGDPSTGNDTWQGDCICLGIVIDCEGTLGGNALPGTPCNDGNVFTGNDTWQSDCTCAGLYYDCQGAPGGTALPGTPCDDGDPLSVQDTWSDGCDCMGLSPDCLGILAGPNLPGTPCDDGNAATANDFFTANCDCVGMLLDCEGEPGGPELPGTPCDDGNAATGNDAWTSACLCIGEAYDCLGVAGGMALPGTPCDDGIPSTVSDAWTLGCDCIGLMVDCAGVINGTAFIDACGQCAGGTTGITPNPDADGDLIADCIDNCPSIANASQGDFDQDEVGDVCDNCPWVPNPDQIDLNGNGLGDACDDIGIMEHGSLPALRVHPNPTTGLVRISSFPGATSIVLLDAPGAVVRALPFAKEVDMSGLAQGSYAIVLLDGEGRPLARARVVRY